MCNGNPCDYNASITITYRDRIRTANGHIEYRTEVIDLDNTIGDSGDSRIADYVYGEKKVDTLIGTMYADLGSLVLGYISNIIATGDPNTIIRLDTIVSEYIDDIIGDAE